MVITIDGLSSTGKSTLAKRIAREMHYFYFNTGLLYRFITYVVKEKKLEQEPVSKILDVLQSLDFWMDEDRMFWDGVDVTENLYSLDLPFLTSYYSTIPEIKEWVRSVQRQALLKGNVVMEGRDIGTRIAPDADVKFYLFATLLVRAERLMKRNPELTKEQALLELEKIDQANVDSKDFCEPIDAVRIDTSHLTLDEVYFKMMEVIQTF